MSLKGSSLNRPMPQQPHLSLRREVGVVGAVLLGLGSMVGTGVFVGLAIAMEVAGDGIFIAILIAGLLAMCNGLSSAQLAAVHPVSGGTYEYGYRFLSPALGFLAGWMFLVAKSASGATAALGIGGYVVHATGLDVSGWLLPIAWFVVMTLSLVAWFGLRRTNLANAVLLTMTLGGLVLFVVMARVHSPQDWVPSLVRTSMNWREIGYGSALVFVAFTGYGRVATLGEEIRNPARSIPVAVVVTVLVTLGIYLSIAVACHWLVGTGTGTVFDDNIASLANLANEHLGHEVAMLVTVSAVTAMLGVLLNLVVGLSRIVLAMARRHDLPGGLAKINEGRTSPTRAVSVVGVLLLFWVSFGSVRLAWSLSALTVLVYYGIANLAALRVPRNMRTIPAIVPVLGLGGCVSLTTMIEPTTWLWGGATAGLGMCGFWIKHLVAKKAAS